MTDHEHPCAAHAFLGPPEVRDEPEGAAVPEGLEVVDAHVHLFPDRVFQAMWRWFDRHAWNVRYRLHTEEVVAFLASRGIRRFVALHYSHKPDMARELNRFVAEVARAHPEVIPLATVLPGEPNARAILREAFGKLDLRGVKLHCHVQAFAPDDPRLDEVYEECVAAGKPLVVHSGRQPVLGGYPVDPRLLCSADRIERVLEKHPKLTLVVPHLGIDEAPEYERLLDRHENLWLDTTMVIADWLGEKIPPSLFPGRAARLLYGTDFPNIPYAWDRELKKALAAGMDAKTQRAFFLENARRIFET